MNTIPVLIVGAGPTGLTLACDLARRGLACRVVEKAPRLFVGSRAKGLQPRTLEVFDDLGVLDAVRMGGAPFPPFRLYSGMDLVWERSLEEMLQLPPTAPTAGVPYPRPWLIPQWRTDEILRDRFVALGGVVETATELVGIEPKEDGVSATLVHDGVTETVFAEYLVGADGGRSFVRKAGGFTFEGETTTSEHTLIGDVRATGLRGSACHILTQAGDVNRRFSLWNLPHSDHYQFVATMAADECPALTLDGVRSLLIERTGRSDIALDELRWISLYKTNIRMVDRMRIGRIFVAGDAAHVHSAAGGQGLNTGVQDAYNLGWKLATRSDRLLDTYNEERLPVAAHVLGMTSQLQRSGFGTTPPAKRPSIDQLDIGYRASSLSFDDGTLACLVKSGDRAPDALLPDGTRLFDAFRGPHFTLLVFGSRDWSAAPTGVRVVRLERSLDAYGVDDGFVLVRPDGHIGALASSEGAIRDYLSSGSPRLSSPSAGP